MKIPTLAVVILIVVVVSVVVVSIAPLLSLPRLQLTKTTLTTDTEQFHPTIPWEVSKHGFSYLVVPNHCSGGTGPCFNSNFSEAYIFTCLKEAATPQGCTVRVNSTTKYWEYSEVTVWYPYHNQTAGGPAWSNCAWDWQGKKNPNRLLVDFPAYCAPVGANGFVLIRTWEIP